MPAAPSALLCNSCLRETPRPAGIDFSVRNLSPFHGRNGIIEPPMSCSRFSFSRRLILKKYVLGRQNLDERLDALNSKGLREADKITRLFSTHQMEIPSPLFFVTHTKECS